MDQLLAKYFAGEATKEEEQEILEWRSSSEEHSKQFLEAKTAWIETNEIKPDQQLLDEIVGPSKPVVKIRQFYRYAAVLVIGIATIVFTYWYNSLDTTSTLTHAEFLHDGSEVIKYRNASLEVLDFDKTREVKVDGKLYFDIKRNEDAPFIIYTEEAVIKVLGTSFVVNAKDKGITEVLVESGSVLLSRNPNKYPGQPLTIELVKGEKGIIHTNARGLIKQQIEDANYLSWMNGIMTFKSAQLSSVADKLKEVYGYDVVFENRESLNCKLTAKFDKKSFKEVSQIIASTFDLSYEISDGTITFKGHGCN